MEINKNDINNKIYFLDNTDEKKNGIEHKHENLKEMNDLNTQLYINDIEYPYQKSFIPEKEGIYTIKLLLNFCVKDCSYMFAGCEKIETIDLSSFNSQNVTDMSSMFYCCKYLKHINLTNFNTKNVKDISHMFNWCENLKNIDYLLSILKMLLE